MYRGHLTPETAADSTTTAWTHDAADQLRCAFGPDPTVTLLTHTSRAAARAVHAGIRRVVGCGSTSRTRPNPTFDSAGKRGWCGGQGRKRATAWLWRYWISQPRQNPYQLARDGNQHVRETGFCQPNRGFFAGYCTNPHAACSVVVAVI